VTTIAIIGTAGRGSDADRLDARVYGLIREAIRAEVRKLPRPWCLVSGGAAYADHVAVDFFIEGVADSLTLHLPAPFVIGGLGQSSHFDERTESGRTANYYHRLFSDKLQAAGALPSSFDDLAHAIERGARFFVHDGFLSRNMFVGRVDVLIAATFGRGSVPKDGGTKHCWDNSRAPKNIHIPIETLIYPATTEQLSLL